MREMKPLILPKLVAARKSSKSSLDMAADPSASMYSCTDSGFYSVSECSTPPTPGYAPRGHLRYPSSTSSLSSSPANHDSFDLPNASGKLPKLTEEPIEREDYVMLDRSSFDDTVIEQHDQQAIGLPAFGMDFDYDAHDVFSADVDSHIAKRRKSGESPTPSIANRIESRFPSFTRRVRERKRASTLNSTSRSATPSAVPSRAASTRLSPTRTSSLTSSIHQSFDTNDRFTAAPSRSSKERLDQYVTPMPIDVVKANAHEDGSEPKLPERKASTPLLPKVEPNLPPVTTRFPEMDAPSPLQSPSVADPNHSLVATPMGTPPIRAYPTPPLSTRPSMSSFKAPLPGHGVAASDIPPIMLTDPNDKWADKLSHANFTILPEPYVPDVCDAASLRQLFADWEQARCNFTKHLVRTQEHFGVTSKHYKLTEQKWAEIDALWKANHDLAISRATAVGAEPEPTSPVEPAPLSKMPSLNDPKSEGKFPKLGDEDIVGPMVQIAAQIQKTPTKKRAFFKFFSDLKFPGSFLRRSSGIRGH